MKDVVVILKNGLIAKGKSYQDNIDTVSMSINNQDSNFTISVSLILDIHGKEVVYKCEEISEIYTPYNSMNKIKDSLDNLKKEFISSPDYAHSWHCNLAIAYQDVDINVNHELSNKAASLFMKRTFNVRTSNSMLSITSPQSILKQEDEVLKDFIYGTHINKLLKIALNNELIRQNYLNLSLQEKSCEIDINIYRAELKLNWEMYFIQKDRVLSIEDIPNIIEITKNLNKEFTVDGLEDLFSLKHGAFDELFIQDHVLLKAISCEHEHEVELEELESNYDKLNNCWTKVYKNIFSRKHIQVIYKVDKEGLKIISKLYLIPKENK